MKRISKVLSIVMVALMLVSALYFSASALNNSKMATVGFSVSPWAGFTTGGTPDDYVIAKTSNAPCYVKVNSAAPVGALFKIYGTNKSGIDSLSQATDCTGGSGAAVYPGDAVLIYTTVYGNYTNAVIAAANNGYAVTYGVSAIWTPDY